ncbi:hypothetical protein [Streptomyces sp. SID12488]|uniref:hypothetical protein n=1 Tax=Streptomyces sp. SID12488 TaxID=2706040 RepID=UPI0013D93925|nr:hypothetical protein [Streptomyces sp. SID12488]NEA68860.1 hypothetical protein [Streptomyces sp. SID12488]
MTDASKATARQVTEAPLPEAEVEVEVEVEVLGIDETRRGRPRWEQDRDSGTRQPTRDRWHTGFVDAHGVGGPLGQVEAAPSPTYRPGSPPHP